MSNTVANVAYYVLDKLEESTTTLKLQKLVYYCQAWSLAWDEKPLFEEDFQGWANGPVCPELFDIHRGKFVVSKEDFQGWANGPVCPELFDIHRGKFVVSKEDLKDYKECDFTFSEEETMDIVIEDLGDKPAHWLSNLSHSERPWIESREGLRDGEIGHEVIDKETMQDFYRGL